jgi:hypothetical protein
MSVLDCTFAVLLLLLLLYGLTCAAYPRSLRIKSLHALVGTLKAGSLMTCLKADLSTTGC